MGEKKIGRNEPCPCGSGKKYKKCHLDRASAAPIPYHQLGTGLVSLRSGDKHCLYPPNPSPCGNPTIRAHTISRSAALTKIARAGKVYQGSANPFAIENRRGRITPVLVQINSATTFTGFCSPHDNALFKPIDEGNLVPTREQVFLLHYRALCRELYVKRPSVMTNQLLRELDRGKPPTVQAMLQGLVTARGSVIDESIKQLEADKASGDRALLAQDYSVISGCFLTFRRLTTIACSGFTQPCYDFWGEEIQKINDMSRPLLNLSFTLLPNGSGGIAVFAWLQDADSVCRPFLTSLLAVAEDRKSDALVQFVLDSFENYAAQPDWWDNLPVEAKTELVTCRRVTITRRLASKLSWPLAAKSCLPRNSIPT